MPRSHGCGSRGRGERPFYLWVHLYDPHQPYEPPDEYRRKAPTPYAGRGDVRRCTGGAPAGCARRARPARNTLIVYLSDHGESLGEHGEPTHGIFLYGATLDVPLIIAPPTAAAARLAGRRSSRAGACAAWRAWWTSRRRCSTSSGCLRHPVSTASACCRWWRTRAASRRLALRPTRRTRSPARVVRGDLLPAIPLQLERARRRRDGALEVRARAAIRALRPAQDPKELHDVSAEHPQVAATLASAPRLDEPARGQASAPDTGQARSRSARAAAGARLRRRGRRRSSSPHRAAAGSERRTPAAAGAAAGPDRPRRGTARRGSQAAGGAGAEGPREPGGLRHALVRLLAPQATPRARSRRRKRAVALDPESGLAVLDLALAFQAAGRAGRSRRRIRAGAGARPRQPESASQPRRDSSGRGEQEKAFESVSRARWRSAPQSGAGADQPGQRGARDESLRRCRGRR